MLSEILNVHSKINNKPSGKKGVFLKKQQQRNAKLSLLLWNSESLTPISARANKNFSYTKAHISLR